MIHGDLAGNLFIDETGSPVVLDLSPYVRPVRYGSAIIMVDHMLWFDGSTELGALVDADALARALTFRMVTEQLALLDGVADVALAEIMSIADEVEL